MPDRPLHSEGVGDSGTPYSYDLLRRYLSTIQVDRGPIGTATPSPLLSCTP